jgi:hypothetical protein
MITTFTGRDAALVRDAAAMLDLLGLRTSNSAVALHALAAAEHLGSSTRQRQKIYDDDRTVLSDALRLLGELSDAARRQDSVSEALHQTMLAYLASR